MEDREARRGLLGRGSLYSVAVVSPVITSLAITPVLTRVLSSTEYGLVALAISVFMFGSMVATGGLNLAITRNASRGQEHVSAAVGLIVVGAAVAGVVGGVALFSLPVWSGMIGIDENSRVLIPAIISTIALAITTLCQGLFRALDKVSSFLAVSFGSALLGPTLGITYLLSVEAQPEIYLWLLASGQLLVAGLAFVKALRTAAPSWQLTYIKGAFGISLPWIPHQIASNLLTFGLVTISSSQYGLEAAGQVQIALLIGTAPITVLSAINNAWAPVVYRAKEETRTQVVNNAAGMISWVVLVLTSGFLCLLPWLTQLVGGGVLGSASDLPGISMIAGSVAFTTLYFVNIHLVIAHGKTALLAVTTPTSVLMTLLFVVVSTSFNGGTFALILFSSALPVFHLVQALFSFFMRKAAGAKSWSLTVVVTPLSLVIVVCVGWGLLINQTRWIGILPLATAFLACFIVWRLVRSPKK